MALDKVTTGVIADDSVTIAKVADDAVGTAEIADDAVTADKLANSINTDIATGVAALPKAGGTMSGNLVVGVGNGAEPTIQSTNSGRVPGNPGFTFADDLDTGMYQPVSSPGNIAFSTNGTEKMRLDPSGNVGIGTSAPSNYDSSHDNLVIAGTGNEGLTIISGTSSNSTLAFGDGTGASGYQGMIAYLNADNSMRFRTQAIERMTIDSAGRVKLPYQPRFSAWKGGGVYTNASGATMPFDQTTTNVGNCYNASTYKFTAPVAGDYWLHWHSIYQGTSTNGWVGFNFSVGTHKGHNQHFNDNFTNSSSWSGADLSGVFTLAANCTVHVVTTVITGWHGDSYQQFSGFLIG